MVIYPLKKVIHYMNLIKYYYFFYLNHIFGYNRSNFVLTFGNIDCLIYKLKNSDGFT